MLDINQSSPNRTFDPYLESPTFKASVKSHSFGSNFHNALKRPLSQSTNHNVTSNNNNSYKLNEGFIFSAPTNVNKENIPHNALQKSFTFSGSYSPTSRNCSIKKHLRKKSSSNIFKSSNQPVSATTSNSFHSHKNSHNRSRSQTVNSYNNHIHGHNRNKSQSSTLKHKKSTSSISSKNSIFKALSTKRSIDSIFAFSNEHLSSKNLNRLSNNNFLFSSSSIQSTPNRSDNDNDSYYSSDEDNINLSNISYDENDENNENDNNNNNDDGDDDDDNSDIENLMDFGSPIQNKVFNKENLKSRIKQFTLQRHQSLMQFSTHNKNNSNFETDQLTSNINGLSVSSDDDEFAGNSVLHNNSINFTMNESSKIPSISVLEFKRILNDFNNRHTLPNKKFCQYFDDLIIVDCRFKFEYDGGHIENAINVSSIDELEDAFFNENIVNHSPLEFNSLNRKLIVFHCEFSSVRGPTKAKQLRSLDRHLSGEFYPNLYYPDVVVLEGGYKYYYDSEIKFQKSLSYIGMNHPLYKEECDRNMDLFRKERELSRKSSRGSSCVSLSRKTSHSSIKSINSATVLDFTSVNKLEFGQSLKQRPSKRGVFNNSNNSNNNLKIFTNNNKNNNNNNNKQQSNDPEAFSILTPKEDGIFGGFGNNTVDLEHLIDIDDNSDIDDVDIEDDDEYNDRVPIINGKTSLSIFRTRSQTTPFSNNKNDGFKIPNMRLSVNRKSTNHSRSKTVATFSYSNHLAFKSAPLLTTPEKSEAKCGKNMSSIFRKENLSFSNVVETLERDEVEYVSIYSTKYKQKHNDTPISKGKH